MSSHWNRWNEWLYPELARFPDQQTRRAVGWEFQARPVIFNWRFGFLLLAAIPIGLLTPWIANKLQIWFPGGSPLLKSVLGCGLIGGVQGLLFAMYLNWAFRKPLRRFLREKLNSLGVPTCVHCGYDVRGLTEPRCPECGVEFAPAAVSLSGADNSPKS